MCSLETQRGTGSPRVREWPIRVCSEEETRRTVRMSPREVSGLIIFISPRGGRGRVQRHLVLATTDQNRSCSLYVDVTAGNENDHLPMAEPGVRAGASSKLLTAARGGAREHLSSAGWVCCGVCEATESKKRIPLARTPLPRRGDLDDITADSRPAPLSRHPRSALPLELPYTPASACRYLVFETARKEKCQLSFARGPRSARCSLRSAHAAF